MTTETSELRRIRIDGLLPKGEFVTEQEYTAEQEDEMRFVAQEAARAVMRKLRPELAEQVEIEKVG